MSVRPLENMREYIERFCREWEPSKEIHVVEAQDRAGYVVKKGTGEKETRTFVSYETCARLFHLLDFLEE